MRILRWKLREYLDNHNIRQVDLARASGIDQRTIGNIAHRRITRVDFATMSRLMTALDCTLDDFLDTVDTDECELPLPHPRKLLPAEMNTGQREKKRSKKDYSHAQNWKNFNSRLAKNGDKTDE